ncbi:MAG: SDR family oxidoreductase [Chloroflexi bacterium]|nr:SDR family oxidoreductase [Chloroflexota bacterium]
MKLAVFGATGGTGVPFVQQALAAGHEVVALVRTPSKLGLQHPRLTLVQGDVMNAADVEKTIQGADVVVSMIGPTKTSPPNMMATAARNIITAMNKCGVRRLVAMTGAGVAFPEDRPKLLNHIIKFALKTISPQVLKDSENYADQIRVSGLDWTLVRVPMLANGPATGNVRVGWVGVNTGPRLVRADAAAFLLRQLDDRQYLHAAPVISN